MSSVTDKWSDKERKQVYSCIKNGYETFQHKGAWIKGSLSDGIGGYCAAGVVLNGASCNDTYYGKSLQVLVEALPQAVPVSHKDWAYNEKRVFEYNDSPYTTLEDVQNWFKRALDICLPYAYEVHADDVMNLREKIWLKLELKRVEKEMLEELAVAKVEHEMEKTSEEKVVIAHPPVRRVRAAHPVKVVEKEHRLNV